MCHYYYWTTTGLKTIHWQLAVRGVSWFKQWGCGKLSAWHTSCRVGSTDEFLASLGLPESPPFWDLTVAIWYLRFLSIGTESITVLFMDQNEAAVLAFMSAFILCSIFSFKNINNKELSVFMNDYQWGDNSSYDRQPILPRALLKINHGSSN